ncbi:hypothetical protein C8R45DRAFT_959898 [Mycena sanguinolenta]|nr:hypothetical protein C8R45DRAFT_959898 [Mycena sanguinolenta]
MTLPRRSSFVLQQFRKHWCRRFSSSSWCASQQEHVEHKEQARLDSAVNWVNRVLKPTRTDEQPLPTTVWVSNVPPGATIADFLHLVLVGPLFRVKAKGLGSKRFIGLTFFENATAVKFYHEMTENEVVLHGSRLQFAWGRRAHYLQSEPGAWYGTRAIFIHDIRQLGTKDDFRARIAQFGPVDHVSFKNDGQSAFVDFLAVKYALRAAQCLRSDGVKVGFGDDRCVSGGRAHASAIQNRVRQVTLSNIPAGTVVAELCDQVRGGALERIVYLRRQRVAFVLFVEHDAALAFWRHAFYHGITVKGHRLAAWMKADKPELAKPVPHIAAAVAQGASRCVHVLNVPHLSSGVIRRDFQRFGPVERIELVYAPGTRNGTVLIAFTDIEHAIKAVRLIRKESGYERAEAKFAPDHCAGPLSGAQRMSQMLQAHMSNLLNLKS